MRYDAGVKQTPDWHPNDTLRQRKEYPCQVAREVNGILYRLAMIMSSMTSGYSYTRYHIGKTTARLLGFVRVP